MTPELESMSAVERRQAEANLELSEPETETEREVMFDLHREMSDVKERLLRQFPEEYVDRAFQEFANNL